MNKSEPVHIPGDLEGAVLRLSDTGFYALRLNCSSEDSWAVIGDASGAIAIDDNGGLMMRFSKSEAERICETMSRERTFEIADHT